MLRKKKQKENEKTNYRSLYFSFSIQLGLFLDEEVRIKKEIGIAIIILSLLQQLSFAFENYYFSGIKHMGFKHFFISVAQFTRPYTILSKDSNQYTFLFPLILLLLYLVISFYLFICFIKSKKTKKIADIVSEQKRIITIILKFVAYCQSLLYYLMFVPQAEMAILSITYYLNINNLNAAALVISILTFLMFLINSFFYLYCIQQSIHIKVKNLNILNQQFSHFLNIILILLIVSLNQIIADQSVKFYLIVFALIIKQLINIYSLFASFQNTRQRILIDLFSETFILTVSLILLFIQLSLFKSNQEDYETLLILIASPVFINIFHVLFNNLHNNLMKIKVTLFAPNILQYYISTILDEFCWIKKSFTHENNLIVKIQSFKELHILQCKTVKCICTQEELSFEEIINLYLKDLVDHFHFAINKIKVQAIRQLYFLHYLSLIHYLGLSTRAFQQSNIVAQQDSDNLYNYIHIVSSSSISKTLGLKNNSQKAESSNSMDHQNSSAQKSKIDTKPEEQIRIKIGNLSFVQRQRLLVMQELIKKTMSTGLGKTLNTILSDSLEHAVKLFLKSEESNKQLKKKIIKMINRKKEFFTNLSMINPNFKLFDQAKYMIIKLTELEDELTKLYIQFPSKYLIHLGRKMQALNTFYQSEVMNNYFQAFKLATITSIADEKLFKMQSQISFDLFSSKLDYLIIGFDEKSHKLQIRQSSNQIHEFFGYNQEKFKLLTNIEHLLPSNFESIHARLVQHFLQVGQSKYFRSINLNYCKFQQRYIKPIDLFYDINVTNLDDLTFACFLQSRESQNAFIFICSNNRIQNMTKNFIIKLGYPVKLIQKLSESMIKQPISKIFPKFAFFSETYLTMDNEEFNQDQVDKSEYQIIMNIPDQQYLESNNAKIIWDAETNLTQFQVEAVFHYRKFKQDINSYLIVELREARKFLKTFSTPQGTENVNPTPMVSESQFKGISEEFEDLELFEDLESQPNLPRAIEFASQPENQINEEQNQSESDCQFGNKVKQHEKFQNQSFFPNMSLVSPKDPASRLIESKIMPLTKQQFFSAQDQKDISSNAEDASFQNDNDDNVTKQQNQIDKLQLEDIDQDLQQNIKMQMQIDEQNQNFVAIDDIGSQVSSIAAFKKSKYSKKYDLIQKLIKSEKFSNYFYLARLFIAILLAVFSIFSVVEIMYSSDDLNRFLAELDMIQIKTNIIAPIDNYIVAQNAVMFYAIRSMIGMMDKTVASRGLIYAQNDILYNYEQLKASYIRQLQNEYLNPFFDNQNILVMMSEQTTTSNRNISIREAMYLSLQAAYEFVLLDYQNIFASLDATSGFFVYLFGNYEVFYKDLTLLNVAMLSYTVQRSVLVKEKWISLMIPILIVGFIILLIIQVFYSKYLQQYNQFLSLFQNLELVWLQRDIDRYRGIASLVIKDSDVLFKYQFDVDLKERFLAAEDIRKEKIAQNQKSNKQKSKSAFLNYSSKVNSIPSFITLSFVYSVCFGFCFISTSLGESYVTKYPDTTNFFNKLNDISIASTGVFSLRQIIYVVSQKPNVAFFFIPNATFFLHVFHEHIIEIDDFLSLISNFDSSNLITTQSFVDKMQTLMSSDVCEFLPKQKIQSAQTHCDALYDGVLRRGFQPTLNTVRNSLLNEQQISKNFSVQSTSLNEELEIALISYDAITNVKSQFQEELVSFTNQLIDQIMIINVCAIVLYILSIIILFAMITRIYQKEFKVVIKFVLLMPQTSLFLDDQLDRNLKQIIIKNNLC